MVEITKIDAFVQSSPHPAWLATSRGECLYVNPALERLTGLKSDQINQVDWRSFVLEEDRAAASAFWQRSLASGTPYRTRVRLRGFDGVPATVELIAFGHALNDGTELWLFTGLHVHAATQQYPRLEAQLQATLNVIPAYTWYALPSGGLTFVNERTADYLGLPKDHPLRFGIDTGAEWDSHIPLLHPDDHEETRRVWSTCLRTGCAGEVSFRVRNAEGGYRWFLSRAEPVRAANGTLLYWIGVNLDIEERKQAEFYLAEGQRLAHTGSWAFTPAGFEYWSSELFQIHGLDPRGNPPTKEEYLALVHPEDREFVEQQIQEMLATHRAFDFTKQIVRPDGQIRSLRCVGVLATQEGTFRRFVGTGMDVTEQEQLIEALRKSDEELRQMLDFAPQLIAVYGPNRERLYANRVTLDYAGLSLNKWLQTEARGAIIHPDDREKELAYFARAQSNGLAGPRELRLRGSDGSYRWFLARYNS